MGLALVLLLAGGPSQAQVAPAEYIGLSAERLGAARELVATIGAADQLTSLIPRVMQIVKRDLVQGRPPVEKDFDAASPPMLDGLSARIPEFAETIARSYAWTFATRQLREINAFYLTPVGQKMRQNPAMRDKTVLLSRDLQQKLATAQRLNKQAQVKIGKAMADELRRRMTEELRKQGHDV